MKRQTANVGGAAARALGWLGVAAALGGCATRKWDPAGLAKAPAWVVSLEHTQAEGGMDRPATGTLKIVPPTVCTANCESTLNALVGELQARGVEVVPTGASRELVFTKVSWEPAAQAAPTRMDLVSIDGTQRVPFSADGETAERCKAAAGEHGTVSGPRLSLEATLTGGGSGADWTYSASRPASLDLVYRSSQVLNKWGYPDPPPGENSASQTLGAFAMGVGGFGMLAGGIWGAIGTRWSEFGRDGQRMFMVGVPVFAGGAFLLGRGNKEVRENPAPVPETGFYKPVEQVLCVGEPSEIVPGAVEEPSAPEPAVQAASGTSSFDLSGNSDVTVDTSGPDAALLSGAARDFVERFGMGGSI